MLANRLECTHASEIEQLNAADTPYISLVSMRLGSPAAMMRFVNVQSVVIDILKRKLYPTHAHVHFIKESHRLPAAKGDLYSATMRVEVSDQMSRIGDAARVTRDTSNSVATPHGLPFVVRGLLRDVRRCVQYLRNGISTMRCLFI